MITGKDSWKFLVAAIIVMVIACVAGIKATLTGTTGYVFGVLNIALGAFWCVKTYIKLKDK